MAKTTTPSRTFLGTGWQFPIRVNPQGGLSFSSGEQNIAESIWLILATGTALLFGTIAVRLFRRIRRAAR